MHAFVCEPETENVPATQLAMTAFSEVEQGVVTRWPGPAVAQAEHVGLAPAADA